MHVDQRQRRSRSCAGRAPETADLARRLGIGRPICSVSSRAMVLHRDEGVDAARQQRAATVRRRSWRARPPAQPPSARSRGATFALPSTPGHGFCGRSAAPGSPRGSGVAAQAPALSRFSGSGHIAALERALEVGRRARPGLVWWQMSAVATSTRRGRLALPSRRANREAAADADRRQACAAGGTNAAPPPAMSALHARARRTWPARPRRSTPARCRSSTRWPGRGACRITAPRAWRTSAPRGSFWNAIAPIIDAIIMSLRACRFAGSATAVGKRARGDARVPSSAMPSHSGW